MVTQTGVFLLVLPISKAFSGYIFSVGPGPSSYGFSPVFDLVLPFISISSHLAGLIAFLAVIASCACVFRYVKHPSHDTVRLHNLVFSGLSFLFYAVYSYSIYFWAVLVNQLK